jgi:hypothetical protein
MSTHIEIDRTTRLGARLGGIVETITSVQNQVANAKAVYDQLALDGDYAALAVALGLTGANAPAEAEAIYNLLGSVQTEQNASTFTQQLISRLG